MNDSDKRPSFSPIAAVPADVFDNEPIAAAVDTPIEPAAPLPPIICQWCMAAAPAGSSRCPACGGSIAERPETPATLPGRDDFGLMAHFLTDENPRLRMVESYLHQRIGIMPVSDRRSAHRDYFEQALDDDQLAGAGLDIPPRLCRWCNTLAGESDERCPSCGTQLPALAADVATVPETPAETETDRRCQWCQANVAPEMETCPACGGTLANPDRQVTGLTDLTPVERAAEIAFGQAPPLHHPLLGADPRERDAAQRARELLRRKSAEC